MGSVSQALLAKKLGRKSKIVISPSTTTTASMEKLVFSLPVFLLLPILVDGFPKPQGYSVDKEYPDIEPKYQYQYAVADDYTNSKFQAEEERDGFSTLGSYRVALPDGRIQIVTYTANKDGYVAEVTYEGKAVYPEDFEAQHQHQHQQQQQTERLYSGSPSIHSNTVYKANRKKSSYAAAKPSAKKTYKQTSRYQKSKTSEHKPSSSRPIIKQSSYSKNPPKVEPKPVKIPYNQNSFQFNPVPSSPSFRPIPTTPDRDLNRVAGPHQPKLGPVNRYNHPPPPYDRVRFEEILKEDPSPHRPEPRQPLAPESRIQTEGVLLEPSVAGEKYSEEEISKNKSIDKVEKLEEKEKVKSGRGKEGTTSDTDLQNFDKQEGEEEVMVKKVDGQQDNDEVVAIDEREEMDNEISKVQVSEEDIVKEEPSPQRVEPHEEEVTFEKDTPLEADTSGEVVKAEQETVEEPKTEETEDISKEVAVVLKTPQTKAEK